MRLTSPIFMNEKIVEVRAVLKFLIIRGLSNEEILNELHTAYGEDCISLRTVQDRRKRYNDGTFSIFDLERSGRPEITKYDKQISDLLAEDPSLSSRNIAETLGISKTTVKNIIKDHLGMHKVNFKWIPHQLTPELRAQRVKIAGELLDFFKGADERTLNSVYTEDETWIYYDNPRTSMWILNGKPTPTIERRNIQSKKLMIAVFWTRKGIKSIVPLSKGKTFNREFFFKNVVCDLQKNDKRKFKYFHYDNARPHLIDDKLKGMDVVRLPHPPYSPDLAPSDFFLFGYLKMKLEGCRFKDEIELLKQVDKILGDIPDDFFYDAFEEWIKRLDEVIKREGDYLQ